MSIMREPEAIDSGVPPHCYFGMEKAHVQELSDQLDH